MTDLEEMRKRYNNARFCDECERTTTALVCEHCGDNASGIVACDPAVLALCDEVEALRARVAAAPEVLREWPARAEDAPGEWFLCLHGARAPRGEFEANGDRKPLFRDEEGDIWPAHEFEPGEFFVRVP